MMDHEVRDTARLMRRELDDQRLVVALVPAPDPRHRNHKIRVVESRNPWWYRELCAAHIKNRTAPRRRKDKYIDTKIVRGDVIRALKRIEGGRYDGVYAQRLFPFIEKWWLQFV